ncbi:hypothetical protein [Thalassoroseus pseudoceratinae]|uniref:hypothetical protein n=1 Tax=Thalassoroseus pseudoceratinae TaxID=2713176 RepID=UPI001F0F2133|nr:hypothetical protein [Thalassoroseus pseudoceratinae]
MKTLAQLWNDEAGFIVSSELVLIATIVVIGLIAGLTAVRDAVVGELADVGAAVGDVNQSFSFGAITGHCSSTAGSIFSDEGDFCEIDDANNDTPAIAAQCIDICIVAATPE